MYLSAKYRAKTVLSLLSNAYKFVNMSPCSVTLTVQPSRKLSWSFGSPLSSSVSCDEEKRTCPGGSCYRHSCRVHANLTRIEIESYLCHNVVTVKSGVPKQEPLKLRGKTVERKTTWTQLAAPLVFHYSPTDQMDGRSCLTNLTIVSHDRDVSDCGNGHHQQSLNVFT